MVNKRICEAVTTKFVGIFDAKSNELDSCMISTHETKIYQLFANKSTNRYFPMVGDQQTIEPPNVVQGNGTSAAHAVPPTGHVTSSEG